jgi:ABC-type glycerol-3-phosphate transport system permease component
VHAARPGHRAAARRAPARPGHRPVQPGAERGRAAAGHPVHPQWSNLSAAWTAAPFGRFFLNTAIFSIVTTAGQILTGLLAGYAFAMFDFPAKRILFYLVLSGLMIPFTIVLVPVVQLPADVGWVDTYQGLIVPNLASALGAFLFRQFFLSVPLELGEAARIDGASEWRIFWRVYRPLAQPMTAAFTIEGTISKVSYNLLMAGSLIAVVPVLVVALIVQRRVVEGLTLGAVR